jgi:hypothetical protein
LRQLLIAPATRRAHSTALLVRGKVLTAARHAAQTAHRLFIDTPSNKAARTNHLAQSRARLNRSRKLNDAVFHQISR